METTETQKTLTPLQKRIQKLEADAKANLEKEIEKVTKEENSKEGRKILGMKIKDEKAILEIQHNGYIKDFENDYGVKYNLHSNLDATETQTKLTVLDKCKLIDKESLADGTPKYKLSIDEKAIIGAKGEPIRTVIKFDDSSNKPQTLGVITYYKYLKPDTTKEDIEKLFPKKDIVIDKLREGTLTE